MVAFFKVALRRELIKNFLYIITTGKVSSCVNIEHDEDIYTLDASQGRWPRDGFCRARSAYTATEPDMYRISAEFYVPGTKDSMLVNYVGVFFNAENEDNFDFIFFR